MIKDQMDKKFGSPWHVIVGRAFAYEITYEVSQVEGRVGGLLLARSITSVDQHPPPHTHTHTTLHHSQLRNILYLYVGGTTGVLVWKM
jgi:hypothetical protein